MLKRNCGEVLQRRCCVGQEALHQLRWTRVWQSRDECGRDRRPPAMRRVDPNRERAHRAYACFRSRRCDVRNERPHFECDQEHHKYQQPPQRRRSAGSIQPAEESECNARTDYIRRAEIDGAPSYQRRVLESNFGAHTDHRCSLCGGQAAGVTYMLVVRLNRQPGAKCRAPGDFQCVF